MAAFLGIVTMLIAIMSVFLLCPPQTDALAPPPSPTAAASSPAHPTVAGELVIFEWPMAYCLLYGEYGECKDIPDDKFLMHGVWPVDGQGIYHQGYLCIQLAMYSQILKLGAVCNRFEKLLSGLNRQDKAFWAYEWDTHRSCSGQTVKEYFTHSLDLCLQYNRKLYQKLVEAGIRPSTTTNMKDRWLHTPKEFYDAIHSKLNIVPIIVCKKSAGRVFLLQIRLCAAADLLTFQNCPRRNNFKECGDPYNDKVLFYTSSYRAQVLDYLSGVVNATSTKNA